ncbi:MAG TPA: hypothetical protein P5316_00745 [Phycisphaerae bacterium]|nr:hypothetical protein [Phycisphaerae bacterium]
MDSVPQQADDLAVVEMKAPLPGKFHLLGPGICHYGLQGGYGRGRLVPIHNPQLIRAEQAANVDNKGQS